MGNLLNRIFSGTFALLSFTIFIGLGTPSKSYSSKEPKNIHVGDLLHKLTRAQAIQLLGREHFIDSVSGINKANDVGPVHNEKSVPSEWINFGYLTFEGFSSEVMILFAQDSSTMVRVSVPYPMRIGHSATLQDFNAIAKNIAKTLGEPTVSTEAYIDYMLAGMQSVFGQFKDGAITINIFPRIGP